jgi:nicotinamidase/pyrazinamidase
MNWIDPAGTALLVIDMQLDFMPGGALPVQGAPDHHERLVAPVRELMDASLLPLQVATQDWHPAGHVSFASSHPGREPFERIDLHGHGHTLWPDHCVQGIDGAALHPGLPLDRLSAIPRKGMDPQADSYSGFCNNWGPDGRRASTGLAGYLEARGIDTVVCVGLARDVCVKWTAQDAAMLGLRSLLVWNLTWPVDADNDDATRAELEAKGVKGVEILTSGELLKAVRG